MTNIDLSVIVVSYNTKNVTIDCLKSILNEGSKVNTEIIVVDNNSKDDSVKVIKKLSFENKKIKLLINDKNVGFSRANNQGIKIAKGKYILLLNSDAFVKSGVFKKLLDFAEGCLDAGAVVPRLLNKDGSIQPSCFNHPTLWRTIKQYWLHKGKPIDKYYPKSDGPVVVESPVMAAFLITPKALKKVGFLDERYFMYYEDHEYCRQIEKAGLKIYYLPSAEVIHLHGESGKKSINDVNQWRRQIPSSKIYHGTIVHYLIFFIMWTSQKVDRIKSFFS